MKQKEFIITIIFVLILLIVFSFFPVRNIFQQLITTLLFFIIIPIIFNKVFLKKQIGQIGIRLGDWKQGLFWSGTSIIVTGLSFLIAVYFFCFF